ncbi:hypothetical protein H9Q72_001108 [Fusarium xylarioides]|uniref:Ankyrin repeat protein n=1 Tax=Fusarium xylarioides TaxID=221167 RepID=A0A9P7I8C5_9HYPO|nr:hypothetical protein H9Q72_001108 [Fusarium xylarioides]
MRWLWQYRKNERAQCLNDWDPGKEGSEDLIARLVEAGANANQYFSRYGPSITPPYAASKNGHLVIMRQFLDAVVAVDGRTRYLGTPLLAAVSKGQVEGVTLLLDAGADLEAQSEEVKYPASVVALDRGYPEAVAASKRYQDVAEKLLDADADPAKGGGHCSLCFVAAAARKHVGVVKIFIDRGRVQKDRPRRRRTVCEMIEPEVDSSSDVTESEDDKFDEFCETLEMLDCMVE